MSCAKYFYICITLFNLCVPCLSQLIEIAKVKVTHHIIIPLFLATAQITQEKMLSFR